MFRAAYSDFLLSAVSGNIDTEVFLTNSTSISSGTINNQNTTAIVLTAAGDGGYLVSNLGSFAATLSFKPGQTNKNIGPFGFTIDSIPISYSSLNYSWHLDSTGFAYIYESGSPIGSEAYTTNTTFKIIFKNNTISYYKDDTLLRQIVGVNYYLRAGMTLESYLNDSGGSLTNINYARYNTVYSQPAPYTVTFQPSSINFEDQFVSKITYVMPDRVVTRNFTFSTLQDALTGTTKDIDSRSNYSYTFYNAASGELTHVVTISAILFPSLSALEYKISIPVTKPRFTRNPSLSSGDTFLFDSAFLLKSRAWGPNNTVVLVGEGINYDNTNQLFLLSATQ